MKPRFLLAFVVLASFVSSTAPVQARDFDPFADDEPDAMAADALIARPAALASTVIGTGLFLASLPITIISGSTYKAAKSLVGRPAKLTFKRKLGKLSKIEP